MGNESRLEHMDHMRLLDSCSHHDSIWDEASLLWGGQMNQASQRNGQWQPDTMGTYFLFQHTSGQLREKVGSSKKRFPKLSFLQMLKWSSEWDPEELKLALSPMILGGVAGCRDWLLSCVSQKNGRFGQRKEEGALALHPWNKARRGAEFPSGWERGKWDTEQN